MKCIACCMKLNVTKSYLHHVYLLPPPPPPRGSFMLLTVLWRWSRCCSYSVWLWFILRHASCFKVFPCSLSSCFFIPFSIVITSLGEEGAGLCASRAFVCLFCTRKCLSFFLFLLVSGVGCDVWLWHSLDFSINVFIAQQSLTMLKGSKANQSFVSEIKSFGQWVPTINLK